jgi:hypothetical protein
MVGAQPRKVLLEGGNLVNTRLGEGAGQRLVALLAARAGGGRARSSSGWWLEGLEPGTHKGAPCWQPPTPPPPPVP